MYLPWQVFVLIMLTVVILIVIKNSLKFRKEFGKGTMLDKIRARYPNAIILRVFRAKSDDSK